MKRNSLFLILLTIILSSGCGRDIPVIDSSFQVDRIKIVKVRDQYSLCMYTSFSPNSGEDRGMSIVNCPASILAPCGIYNVGDTVKLK